MALTEKVARSLCWAACVQEDAHDCPHCVDKPDCTMWATFEREGREAIGTVRAHDRGRSFVFPNRGIVA